MGAFGNPAEKSWPPGSEGQMQEKRYPVQTEHGEKRILSLRHGASPLAAPEKRRKLSFLLWEKVPPCAPKRKECGQKGRGWMGVGGWHL